MDRRLQSFWLCGIPNGTTVYTGFDPDRAMTSGDKASSSTKSGILFWEALSECSLYRRCLAQTQQLSAAGNLYTE